MSVKAKITKNNNPNTKRSSFKYSKHHSIETNMALIFLEPSPYWPYPLRDLREKNKTRLECFLSNIFRPCRKGLEHWPPKPWHFGNISHTVDQQSKRLHSQCLHCYKQLKVICFSSDSFITFGFFFLIIKTYINWNWFCDFFRGFVHKCQRHKGSSCNQKERYVNQK